MSRAPLVCALTTGALLLGACGGDGDSASPNPTPTPTPTATPQVRGAISAAAQEAASNLYSLQRATSDSASSYATAETSQHRLTREELAP